MSSDTLPDRYWLQFKNSSQCAACAPDEYYETYKIGASVSGADTGAGLIRAGVKTATDSLLWAYDHDGRPAPAPGDLSIVLWGDSRPACIVETTEIRIIAFDAVDAEFAYAGGEGDRTLESWRTICWEYLSAECARIGRQPAPDMPVVCERFRVVYGEPLLDQEAPNEEVGTQ